MFAFAIAFIAVAVISGYAVSKTIEAVEYFMDNDTPAADETHLTRHEQVYGVTPLADEDRASLTADDESIIGIRDAVLIQNPESALTVNTFNTTLYADRAFLQLENTTASEVVINGLSIRGKLVVMSAGQSGYVWEYSDFDDIEKNGERFFEISNDYMMSPDQVESVGDFCWKTLKPHNVYQLQLVGCQHQYQIGDFYQLTVDYQLPTESSQIESIDVAVEVMNVSFSRTVGGVGQTVLTVRQAIGTWNKTTSHRARLVGAGSPQFLLNRGNTVTVASSTWTGQADYYCDGVDDNVQIQAAIDSLASTGGGEVILTKGIFTIASTILAKDNITIVGDGASTILKPSSGTVGTIIDIGLTPANNVKISKLSISGSGITHSVTLTIINGRSGDASYNNIIISDFTTSESARFFHYASNITNCTVQSNTSSKSMFGFMFGSNMAQCSMVNNSASIELYGFYFCNAITLCSSTGNTTTSITAIIYSFSNCDSLSSCFSTANTASGTTTRVYSFNSCSNITSSISQTNNATGTNTILYSFASCTNITSCESKQNTTSGATSPLYSFSSCTRVGLCSTSGNTTPGGGARIGFTSCRSVQQCKSSGDATAYNASYADSGTANPCADTAAGGYNS